MDAMEVPSTWKGEEEGEGRGGREVTKEEEIGDVNT